MLSYNKKGAYLPLFVLVVPFILATLYGIMYITEANKEDLVGLRAAHLVKVYDESEKIQLFFNLASKYASSNALNTLAANGGYSENNRCHKTEKGLVNQEQYVIWNTCPVLSPSKEFETQFKKELKQFLEIYESTYKQTDYEELFELTTTAKINYSRIYTENTRKAEISNMESTESELIVLLSSIDLPVEGAEDSKITINPKATIKKPDISDYEKIHFIVKNNCINKEVSECKQRLRQEFSTATIKQENHLLKITIPLEDYTVRFGVLKDNQIPSYEE